MDKLKTIIRKSFTFNNMHIVRNCTSSRCSQNLHAHTYKIEIFFESDTLDKGYMVLDFGILKNSIKELIKSFDNSVTLWSKEESTVESFVNSMFTRIIELPISPSAESFARVFYTLINSYIMATEFKNGEGNIKLHKVRVHETRTGYAEVYEQDCSIVLEDIKFSDDIKESWDDPELFLKVQKYLVNELKTKPIVNPEPHRQIKE